MSSTTMLALVQRELQPKAVSLEQVPLAADPEPGEVRLRVEGVSVCGSDVHQYLNRQSWPVRVPVILGHEFGGTVEAVGTGVTEFRAGDRVVSETAARICGICSYCRGGRYNLCPRRLGFGYGLNGAMAEAITVPARCLHHLPASVSFEVGALTEPCCVAFNAVCVQTRVQPGDRVVVLGPGPIGLLCAQMARLAGAAQVIVAGTARDAARLEAARAAGADQTWNLEAESGALWRQQVADLGDGLGVEVVIDATGASPALATALEMVRPGGQITKVGWGAQPLGFSLDPLVQKAVTLRGSFSHTAETWERVLALLAGRRLHPELLISRVAPLPEWRECFDGMHSGALIKAVLLPQRRA